MPRGLLCLIVCWSWIACVTAQADVGEQAQWIWSTPDPRPGEMIRLRRTIEISRPVRRAELRGLADDLAAVLVDGKLVDRITSSRKFSTIDLSQQLTPGKHTIEIEADNREGMAGVWVQLDWVSDDGSAQRIVTDTQWEARVRNSKQAAKTPTQRSSELEWHRAHSFGLLGVPPWWRPAGELGDYDQWKRAIGTGEADDAARIRVVPGFQVERLRSSQKGEGSWVSLTFDNTARLIIGREGPGILRMTNVVHVSNVPGVATAKIQVELINDTLQECRGLLWAFDSLYANANNSKALYRLKDTDGDDQFDDVKLLKATGGGVGHGRNALALGPDNMIYVIHGNNVLVNDNDRTIDPASPLRFIAEDRLRPAFWDRFMFDSDARVPAGYVARTDADGKVWQVVAGGFRNPYGIDFNSHGDMFTFDADNEGDQGTPWYRPTRFNHIVGGGDYGFRQGSANRPGRFAEHLPPNLEMGLASPTGVKSGHRSAFPNHRDAMFICDWSYGRIYAIHLEPDGASYRCRAELFLEGQPLNVTDLTFGPDGAMYFVTGGRGTQSGLYRVRFVGPAPSQSPNHTDERTQKNPANPHFELRRTLERWHSTVESRALDTIWQHLGHSDVWIRHAARVALENQPLNDWLERALSSPTETKSAATTIAALLAVVRGAASDKKSAQRRVFQKLNNFTWNDLTPEQQLDGWRVYAVAGTRLGRPTAEQAAAAASDLARSYPHDLEYHNQRLCELLAYLEWSPLVEQTIPRLEAVVEQEDKLAYLNILRDVRVGWTLNLRKRYFAALQKSDLFDGGNLLPISINGIREDALGTLFADERRELGALLEPAVESGADAPTTSPARPVVREWKLEDFDDLLKAAPVPRDAARGQRLFRDALCLRCHRFGAEGRTLGPDLTFVANRFGPRDLLDHILAPSKVIDGKYRQTIIETKSGQVHVGRVIGGDDSSLLVATDPLRPTKVARLALTNIEARKQSPVSPMPVGLLNSLTNDDVLNLLEYLRSGRPH